MKRVVLSCTALALPLLLLASTPRAADPKGTPAAKDAVEQHILDVFTPLPARFESDKNPTTADKVALGRMLYYDTRFSRNHDLSCNSCHDLAKFGVDGKRVSDGHKGQKGDRNSPTVYNAGGHIAQFWDGRAADLEEQAKGPVLNPVEMAMPNDKHVLKTIQSIPGYVDLFKLAFPGQKNPVTYDNFGRAIGAFERGLVTPSRFDKFLSGDKKALTAREQQGLRKFFESGCTTCHNGPAVGGAAFQRLGLVKPFPHQKDLGRFKVTKQDSDKMVFRVASLRNIEKTGPYLHDGSETDLGNVVKLMGRHQLGRELPDADVAVIVEFLKALTGELPSAYIAKPELPPSGPKTPKPDPS
jgi:cytochrome c peroxidase